MACSDCRGECGCGTVIGGLQDKIRFLDEQLALIAGEHPVARRLSVREMMDVASQARKELVRSKLAPFALRPESEWHEDYGEVLWWVLPIREAPWVGSPNCTDWVDNYFTHWSPLPVPSEPVVVEQKEEKKP